MESAEIILEKYKKHTIAIRHTLLGRGWYSALNAMEFAMEFHKGTRKDKVTPEFYHQIEVAGFLLTLSDGLLYPDDVIAVSFLHDCPEDYDVGFDELDIKFGVRISSSVKNLTKIHRGQKVDPNTYFHNMINDPIASVVKGSERIDNQRTIVGVFSRAKQDAYILETNTQIIPMLKLARKACPKQYNAYRNIMFVLRSQVNMISAVHTALDLKE